MQSVDGPLDTFQIDRILNEIGLPRQGRCQRGSRNLIKQTGLPKLTIPLLRLPIQQPSALIHDTSLRTDRESFSLLRADTRLPHSTG